jgi:hypothetical protein
MQVKASTAEARPFQFPKPQRGGEGERHFNEQTLKLLLKKKKKEDLRLSKPLLFPNQAIIECQESPKEMDELSIVLNTLSSALAFSQTYIETKTSLTTGPSFNSITMLIKDKDQTLVPPEDDANR